MLSDVSSLTDLSSDDDSAFAPNNKGKSKGKASEYTLKGSLKPPRTVSYSAKHLYENVIRNCGLIIEEIMEGRIDLNPEYQRDVVWPDQKQIGLIDSILRNFYIPPIIFAVATAEDGEEKRTCIDGKQRLTSIQRFLDGFKTTDTSFGRTDKDSRTNVKMWYKLTSSNAKGKLLPPKYRNQFASKQIVCVEYADIVDDAEREIFQRVQLGVALTPAERMQAIPGPWSQLIREVLNLMSESRMGEHLEWSSSRGRDFQCVATALYLMEKKDVPNKTFPSPIVLDRWLQRVTPPAKVFKERVVDTFCVFRNLVLEKTHSKVFQKPSRVSPIEFVMVAVLIDLYMTKYTLSQLAIAISKMRADVRSKHSDVRANSRVTKTMLAFIEDKVPGLMKKPENGEKTALQDVRLMPPPSAPRENGKRKRARGSSLESEGSDDAKPLKSKVSPVKKTARTVSGVASGSKAASPALSKTSVDRMSVDRPPTPQASSSRATGPGSASTSGSRLPAKPASTVTTMASTPRPTGSAGMRNDRLAAMRAAKAATSGVKPQTPTPTPPPRAPSRQSTSDASMPPPSTTPMLTGVDMSAVQNALQRTTTGQMMVDAMSWPGQVPQAQTQMSTMYNQLHQQQQQQQQQPQPQVQQYAQPTPSVDPRMHPSRQAAMGLSTGMDQSSLPPRGAPHPEQLPPNPYQGPNAGSYSGPPPPGGGGAVPPRHRDRVSRFDWQSEAKTNGGGH